MHPLLRKARLSRFDQRDLRPMLECGPWCWPDPVDTELLERLVRALGLEPPAPRIGQVLLVAVKETDASLFTLRPDFVDGVASRCLPLGPTAKQAWRTAATAIPSALPVLWRSVDAAQHRSPWATLVLRWPNPGQAAVPDAAIDGDSFGLGMAMAIASMVLGVPVPDDIVASAAVDERGAVSPVDGLERKVRIVGDFAPRVRRILVSAEQRDEAAGCQTRLDVVGVKNVSEALDLVFPDLLGQLAGAGNIACDRNEIFDALFRLGIEDRSAFIHWKPIQQAAQHALENWPDLSQDEQFGLEVVRAVAARHDGSCQPFPMPNEAWLAQRPLSVRLKVISHLLQQAASFGQPGTDEVRPLVRAHLVRGLDATRGHLRMLGAHGRLLTVSGRHREAMEQQREAARGWLARYAFDAISMPLCEWMRLAGALRDTESGAESRALHRMLTDRAEVRRHDLCYLNLSAGRLGVMLGDLDEGLPILQDLTRRGHTPEHVRLSAHRWLARGLREAGNATSAAHWIAQLHDEVTRSFGHVAPAFLGLAELDAALDADEIQTAEWAVARIRQAFPHLVDQLCSRLPDEVLTPLEHVRDFFPY